MRCAKNRANNWTEVGAALALLLAVAVLVNGCTDTVHPALDSGLSVASYDGSERNSGILYALPNSGGFVVTPHWRDRYNALIAVYGAGLADPAGVSVRPFFPALKTDDGLTPHDNDKQITYQATPLAMEHFLLMKWAADNGWKGIK